MATGIYKKTNSPTAIYGESSPAVLKLQQELIAKGAPITADSKYGPQTQQYFDLYNKPVATTVTTPPPDSAAGIQGSFNYVQSKEDKAEASAMADYLKILKTDVSQSIDPNQIYQQNLSMFQGQIDAINKVYNDQLNKARIEGAGRLESRKFSQGRSGQVGSGTGEAGVNAVQAANRDIESSIDNERNSAIASIMAGVRNKSSADLAARTKAKKEGAEALLKFYDEAPARKAKKVNPVIAQLVSLGIDPEQMSDDEIEELTSGLGISKEEITSGYKAAVKASEKAKADSEAAAMKAQPAVVQEYEYAKKNGYTGSFTQYQNEDANRKAVAARQPKDLTISEQHLTTISNLSQLFVPGAVIPGSQGVPFIDSNGYATPQGFKTAMAAAAQDGLPRADFIKQFGYTIPTGLETKFGLTPAEIKLITGALPVTE